MAEEEDRFEDNGGKPFPVDRAGREIVPGVAVEDRKKPVSKKKKVAKVAPSQPVPVKRYSFTQWAARNGVPAHHRGGLRAFVNNVKKQRTLAEWDACFEGY
jgi:hypothetical protein